MRSVVALLARTAAAAPTTLRIGGFPSTLLPWLERDAASGEYTGGFFHAFYKELAYEMGCAIEWVPMLDPDFWTNVSGVGKRMLQAGAVDVHWDNADKLSHSGQFALATPFLDVYFTVAVKRNETSADMLQMFEPFEPAVWGMMLLSIFFGAGVMVVLRRIQLDETMSRSRFVSAWYHSAAAILGGDECDWYKGPPMGRLYRLGLLFLVLVSTTTYTANLAAFLTRSGEKLYGPKTMSQLKQSKACIRWPDAVDMIKLYVREVLVPPPSVPLWETANWTRAALQRGDCDCIVDADAALHLEVLSHCPRMRVLQSLRFSPVPVYNVLRGGTPEEREFASRVSEATLRLRRRTAYMLALEQNLGWGLTCENGGALVDEADRGAPPRITVTQLGAAFVAFGALGALSVLAALLWRCGARRRGGAAVQAEEASEETLDGKVDRVLRLLEARGGARPWSPGPAPPPKADQRRMSTG